MLQKIKLDYTTPPWACPIKLFDGRNYFRTKVSYGVFQSVTSKWSNICRKGQEQSVGGSTLVGSSLDCIYQTNLEVTGSENALAYFVTKLITSVKSFNDKPQVQWLLSNRNKLECLLLPFPSTLIKYLEVSLQPTRVEPLTCPQL